MLSFGHVFGHARHTTVGLVTRIQCVEQLRGDLLASELTGRVDGIDISHFADFGEVGFAWQREHFGHHGLVQLLIGQHRSQRRDQPLIKHQGTALLVLGDQLLKHLHRQLLTRFPAVEAVAVVLHEEHQLIAIIRKAQFDRRAEAAQQRR
ncbi:hypothetical protein D3C78_1289380 [compost metagenome]